MAPTQPVRSRLRLHGSRPGRGRNYPRSCPPRPRLTLACGKATKIKFKKSGKFSVLKIMVSKHHVHHATTTKSPASYHVVAPQIPATPRKNAHKNRTFAPTHRLRKKIQIFS